MNKLNYSISLICILIEYWCHRVYNKEKQPNEAIKCWKNTNDAKANPSGGNGNEDIKEGGIY